MFKKFVFAILIFGFWTFKCWSQATLNYHVGNVFYINSMPALAPTITGSLSNFTVKPDLPSGLSINPNNGIISSATKLTIVSPAMDYTISATDATPGADSSKPVTFKINIAITDPSLPKIEYSPTNTFTQGVAIDMIIPTITGTGFTGYDISPGFEANTGLHFDNATGIITGTPNNVSANTNYVISGHTAAGDRTANIQVQVTPANMYQSPVIHGMVDTPIISAKPKVQLNNVVYSVKNVRVVNSNWLPRKQFRNSTKLPEGLRLNPATGEISGTPTTACLPTDYIIDATDKTNANKPIEYTVNISVDPRSDSVSTPATISFVGQGDIQQSLNSGAKIAANTGLGVVFKENSRVKYGILHNIEIDFSVNVASTVDTIQSINNKGQNAKNAQDFGNSILLPLNSGQAFSFRFKGYFTAKSGVNGNYRRNEAPKSLGGVLSGFDIALAGSNRNWQYNDTISTNTPSSTQVKTSLLSFYAGPFFEFVTPKNNNNNGANASITLGMGYSGRWILGDAQQNAQTMLRSKLLNNSTANSFNGFEVLLALRFYNIEAEVHLPFFPSPTKNSIPGLSGSHLTTFIGFSGGFPIDLKKPSSQ